VQERRVDEKTGTRLVAARPELGTLVGGSPAGRREQLLPRTELLVVGPKLGPPGRRGKDHSCALKASRSWAMALPTPSTLPLFAKFGVRNISICICEFARDRLTKSFQKGPQLH